MKKITNLKNLYYQLKNTEQTYTVFLFETNKVKFDVLFDIGKNPFMLGFIVLKSNFQLWLEVKTGFLIDINLSKDKYYQLIKLLNLKFDRDNPFSPLYFFEQFNNQIPNHLLNVKKDYIIEIISKSYLDIEEKNKVYYKGLKDWDKINNGKHRTFENLEKTRLLYPDLYLFIKDRDISVLYTSDINEEKQISTVIS